MRRRLLCGSALSQGQWQRNTTHLHLCLPSPRLSFFFSTSTPSLSSVKSLHPPQPPSSSVPSPSISSHSPSPTLLTPSPPLTVAQRCDPYEQKGAPLSTTRISQLLPTLEPGWSYDPTSLSLSKTFTFPPRFPAPSPPPPSPLFAFIARLGHFIENDGHSPYSVTLTPRRHAVDVQLHTVPLHGLSYRDLALAMHLDGVARALNTQNR